MLRAARRTTTSKTCKSFWVSGTIPPVLLSVIIPVYNEARTIQETLRRVAASPVVGQIIVVDDGSTDGTRDRLPQDAILQPKNLGKGAAVRSALPRVTQPLVVVQDADLELFPEDLDRLRRPILEGRADVVFGSRYRAAPWHYPFVHTLGNRALTFWSNLFTRLHLSDVHTCYKLFRSSLIPRLGLCRDRFDFDPELTFRFARLGVRIREVPVRYAPRTEGKKIGWRDAVEAMATTLRMAL